MLVYVWHVIFTACKSVNLPNSSCFFGLAVGLLTLPIFELLDVFLVNITRSKSSQLRVIPFLT